MANKTIQFKRNQNTIYGTTVEKEVYENGQYVMKDVYQNGYEMAREKLDDIASDLQDGEAVLIRYYDDVNDNDGSYGSTTIVGYKRGEYSDIDLNRDRLDKKMVVTVDHGNLSAGTVISAGTTIENVLRQILSPTITAPMKKTDISTCEIVSINLNKDEFFNGDECIISSVTVNANRVCKYKTVENYEIVDKTLDISSDRFTTYACAHIVDEDSLYEDSITGKGEVTVVLTTPYSLGTFSYSNNKVITGTVSASTQCYYMTEVYNLDSNGDRVGTYEFDDTFAWTSDNYTTATCSISGKMHIYGGVRIFGTNNTDFWGGATVTTNLNPTSESLGLDSFTALTTANTTAKDIQLMSKTPASYSLNLGNRPTATNQYRSFLLAPSTFSPSNGWMHEWEEMGAKNTEPLTKLGKVITIDGLSYSLWVSTNTMNVGAFQKFYIKPKS